MTDSSDKMQISVENPKYSYSRYNSQFLKIHIEYEAIKIILYIVIYLKLHPSFEGSMNFAAEHTKGSISSDIKKLMWDLQVGKYKKIEDGLEVYMPKWDEDFVHSLNLIRNALKESSEEGRESIMKNSLDFLLTNTYRKIKKYIENVTYRINIFHFVFMFLSVTGLIIFSLISIFLQGSFEMLYLAIGYMFILPIFMFFIMNRVLPKKSTDFIPLDIIYKNLDLSQIMSDASEKSSVLFKKFSKTTEFYLEDLKKMEMKIRELLEKIKSSIKLQINFMIPFVLAMIGSFGMYILKFLNLSSENNVIVFTKLIPITTLQTIFGIYTLETAFLFTILLNYIENGLENVSRNKLIFISV